MYGPELPPIPPAGQSPGVGTFHRSGDDRLWLFRREWESDGLWSKGEVWATLMIVHGTVDHSGDYAALGERLAAQGIAVFAMDMRGWGLSDGERLYFQDVEVFAQDVVDDYMRIHGPKAPYERVTSRFLLGKGLGGLITAWLSSTRPDMWTGLIGLSGAYQVDPDQKPGFVWNTLLNLLGGCAPKLPIVEAFDPALIVSDPQALREWEQDPLVTHGNLTVAYALELFRVTDILPKLVEGMNFPVLMLWGTGDKVVTGAGHEMMYQASKDQRSQFLKYDKGFHNLLAEPALKDQVISDIESWIKAVVRGSLESPWFESSEFG